MNWPNPSKKNSPKNQRKNSNRAQWRTVYDLDALSEDIFRNIIAHNLSSVDSYDGRAPFFIPRHMGQNIINTFWAATSFWSPRGNSEEKRGGLSDKRHNSSRNKQQRGRTTAVTASSAADEPSIRSSNTEGSHWALHRNIIKHRRITSSLLMKASFWFDNILEGVFAFPMLAKHFEKNSVPHFQIKL